MDKTVFLSYSRHDLGAVSELYSRLKEQGYDIWWDNERLLPGQNWELEITRAIRNAIAVIVCLSSKWVNETGYVQKELRLALDICERKPEGEIFLIPLKLDDCEAPPSLTPLHWIKVSEPGGWDKLCRSLDIKLPKQATVSSESAKRPLSIEGAVLRVEVGLNEAERSSLLVNRRQIPAAMTIDALIDTGASCSCIDERIVNALGIKPTGQIVINSMEGQHLSSTYIITLGITTKAGAAKEFVDLRVVAVKMADHGAAMLLGRDILSHYKLLYDGRSNTFELFG